MNKKSYYIFGFAFLIFIIAISLYLNSINKMKQYVQMVNHTHDVIVLFERLSAEIKTAQMMSSELGKKHQEAFVELYRTDIDSIPVSIQNLRSLVADHQGQLKRIDSISNVYNEHIKWMVKNNSLDTVSLAEQNDHFSNILHTKRLIDGGIAVELKLLDQRQDEYDYTSRKTNVLMAVFLIISSFLIVGTAISKIVENKRRIGVELFLESILNTSQNAIITYEAIRNRNEVTDFKVIFANEAAEKQVAKTTSTIIGQSLLGLSPAAVTSGMMKRYIRLLETGKKDEFETSTRHNKINKWYKVVLSKLNDGFTATYHDITELKKYQEDLQEKVELLEATNSELEQFAYVASHDLQEPLRKIKTYASLIDERLDESSPSFIKSYLEKVIQSADRMSTLISDLLNMSHLSKDNKALIDTDLNKILKNVLVDFELIIKEKKATVTCEELPAIECIPLQMNQLFYNLLFNALKFSDSERLPEIHITVAPVQKEEVALRNLDSQLVYHKISFRDNGIGFDPAYAEKIFVIFQRLNSRLAYAGSGIGLALCRKIALNHHGVIYAEGRQGDGAAFICILPHKQPLEKNLANEPVSEMYG